MKGGLSADDQFRIAWRVWEAMRVLEEQNKIITRAEILHELKRTGSGSPAITPELVEQGMAHVAAWLKETAKRDRLGNTEHKTEALVAIVEAVLRDC